MHLNSACARPRRPFFLTAFAAACAGWLLLGEISHARASLNVTQLKCEQATNPTGIDTPTPRFSWQIESSRAGVAQASYHLLVANSPRTGSNPGRRTCGIPDAWPPPNPS